MTATEKAAQYFIDKFKSYVGYHEKATNAQLEDFTANSGSNNWNRFASAIDKLRDEGYLVYNGKKNGYDWCDLSFDEVQIECWGVVDAQKMLYQPWNSCGAGCEFSANYYRSAGAWYTTPKVGDQIFFGKYGDETHTGGVSGMDDVWVYTVEGNANNQVMERRYRLTDSSISGYGRPNYALVADRFEEKPVEPPKYEWSEEKLVWLINEEITKRIGKQIADIDDIPHKSVMKIARVLLDLEAVDGGTPYSVNPDDINLPYDVLRAIVIAKRYTDKMLEAMKSG